MKRLLVVLSIGLLFVLAACGDGGSAEKTNADIIQAFKDAGLEVGDTSELPAKSFGNTREEGTRILVPSLGEDNGGRLFKFKKESDLAKAKAYYDELSNSGPLFFSHTHQSGNFLLQMNGDMEDAEFKKYADAMDATVK